MNPSPSHVNRKALIAAVVGTACLLGSCAPLGKAAYQSWYGGPVRVIPLGAAAPLQGMALTIEPGRHARVALRVSLKTSEAAAVSERHAALATLKIRDSEGHVLQDESCDTDAGAAHGAQGRIAEAGDDRLVLHYDFPKFMAPANGRILIDAALPAARRDGTVVEAAELTLNDALCDYAVGVTLGVFMLLAGWIAAVVGVLTLLGNPSTPGVSAAPDAAQRHAAMRGHLLGLLGYLLPLGHLLVMARWWVKHRGLSAFVEEHGREALNFQLSILVYLLIAFTLSLVLIGLLMLPLVLLFNIVMMIEAASQARAGHRFRYPLTFRFLRAPG